MTESSKEGLLEELLEIQRTHRRLEAAARGYLELDLTMEQRNETEKLRPGIGGALGRLFKKD